MSGKKKAVVYTCDPKDVVVLEDRQRKAFDENKLRELAESFKQYGQIQPGVCRLEGDKIILVAGERRLRASQLSSVPYSYILSDKVDDPNYFLEIELEENLCRVDLSWKEEVSAKQRLHEIYQERLGKTLPGTKGGHGVRDTARVLNQSPATVSTDIELAFFAQEFEEVSGASSKTEAKKVVKRIKDDLVRGIALKKSLDGDEEALSYYTSLNEPTKEEVEGDLRKRLERYDERCIQGDFTEELSKFPDGHFQLVFFDPPWGVDFDEVKKTSSSKKAYIDKAEDFSRDFPKWIELIYQKMSEHSILLLFFGIANYTFVYDTVERAGFSTNRMPLIWHKKGAHHTRNPKIWFGRSYEPIAYCRKGSKDIQLQGSSDIITTTAPTPKMKSTHPSAKHPDIYKLLLQRVAFPGDRVIDPMAGSGMLGLAAESLISSLSLDWRMIEQDEDYRTLQLTNLMKGYRTIVGETPNQQDPKFLSTKWGDITFRDVEIGGPEWMDYWRDFPQQQEEMIQWQNKNNNH